MNLPLLDIPDDPQGWPAWLEDQIVGPELGNLVEQLEAVLERKEAGPTLQVICGQSMLQVLQNGLAVLTADQVRLLLKHPQRLFDLQECMMVDGGEYWLAKINAHEATAAAVRHWEQFKPHLMLTHPGSRKVIYSSPNPSRRTLVLPAGSLAAAGLLGVGFWQWQQSSSSMGLESHRHLYIKSTRGCLSQTPRHFRQRMVSAATRFPGRPGATAGCVPEELRQTARRFPFTAFKRKANRTRQEMPHLGGAN